jgi:hypothetical protein
MSESALNPPSLSPYVREISFDNASNLMAFLGDKQFRPSRWIFRGQDDAAFSLQPTLERFANSMHDMPEIVEEYIATEFRRNAHHYAPDTPAEDDILSWLALMRHHGALTRLLDFSKSPYIAAFFAIAEAKPDRCAAIWAVDSLAIKQSAGALLSQGSMSVFLKAIGERCLNDHNFSFSDSDVFREVFTLCKVYQGGAFPGHGGGCPLPSVIPVEPFRTNERSLLQQGLFLCPVIIHQTFEHCLGNVVRHAKENIASPEEVLYKIVISPDAHPHTLRELHRMNINYASLLPGLDGLARSLETVSKIRARTVPPRQRPDWGFYKRI